MARYVDNEAKALVKLFRQTDSHGKFFWIGKIQFPGVLNFQKGISFTVIVDAQKTTCPYCKESFKETTEGKMLIGPILDSEREASARQRTGGGTRAVFGKTCVDLYPFTDDDGNDCHIGEALCPTFIDATDGLFFTIFLSRIGEEEIQISALDHSRRRSARISNEDSGRCRAVHVHGVLCNEPGSKARCNRDDGHDGDHEFDEED